MVRVLRALTRPHKYLVPVVSAAVLRERVEQRSITPVSRGSGLL